MDVSIADLNQIEHKLESEPHSLAQSLRTECLKTAGSTFDENALRALVASAPYLLLESAFHVDDLPQTPAGFIPVPLCKTTVRARLAVLALHGLFHKETIAYRSENSGSLFINLVPMPGKGQTSKKSTSHMRGHTDGVSFPFPGTEDPDDARIAPSPDFVTLAGLRNPDAVPTHVIPLDRVLARLAPEYISELEKPQFNIECQGTFRDGTEAILGESHIAVDAEVLKSTGAQASVRFSHSKVRSDVNNVLAAQALHYFQEACEIEHVPLIITPGSLLIINNRRALHGRSELKKDVGGAARWLLRTYALDTEAIKPLNRYEDSTYHLYP